jgi:REP element-mobilizing transposase RayT
LSGWDYRKPASYFITICTAGKIFYLHKKTVNNVIEKSWLEIPKRNPQIKINEYIIMPNHIHGILTITRYPDSYQEYPFPGTICRGGNICRGGVLTDKGHNVMNTAPTNGTCDNMMNTAPTNEIGINPINTTPTNRPSNIPVDTSLNANPIMNYHLPGSIGAIIGGFKISTKRIVKWITKYNDFGWQRDFWDHIIRDDKEYYKIVKYIQNNPKKWAHDRNNPQSKSFLPKDEQINTRLKWHVI